MSQNRNDNNSQKSFYRRHLLLCNLLMMCGVVVFLGFFCLFSIDVWTNHGSTTVVPEVRQKGFGEAVDILEAAGLDVEIGDSVYDSRMKPGEVKEVWPRPGATVKPGRTVFLTINSFQPQQVKVTMPLTGVSSRQAQTYLESIKIRNIKIEYVPSNFPDLVEGAKYKGKNIVPGMQIPVNANVVLYVGNLKQGGQKANTESSSIDEVVNSVPEANETEEETNSQAAPAPDAPAKGTTSQPDNNGDEPEVQPDVFD